MDYSRSIYQQLKKNKIRVELDERSEGVGRKIRDAELQKIPYIIILGDDEEKNENISYRIHKKGDQGKEDMDIFIKNIKSIIEEKGFNYEIT